MNVRKALFAAVIMASGFALASEAMAATPWGLWKRPNGTIAKVWKCGGGMCGKVIKGKKAGFVMFNGIKKAGSVWKGNMKHPDMFSFMTFNGTVKLLSPNKLRVQGCVIGQSMCDAETWVRVK